MCILGFPPPLAIPSLPPSPKAELLQKNRVHLKLKMVLHRPWINLLFCPSHPTGFPSPRPHRSGLLSVLISAQEESSSNGEADLELSLHPFTFICDLVAVLHRDLCFYLAGSSRDLFLACLFMAGFWAFCLDSSVWSWRLCGDNWGRG